MTLIDYDLGEEMGMFTIITCTIIAGTKIVFDEGVHVRVQEVSVSSKLRALGILLAISLVIN